MTSFVKPCSYCGHSIEMNDKEGRFLPFNENGSRHFCLSRPKN
jgi:hypothetical protein